jgi:hypothetical protein
VEVQALRVHRQDPDGVAKLGVAVVCNPGSALDLSQFAAIQAIAPSLRMEVPPVGHGDVDKIEHRPFPRLRSRELQRPGCCNARPAAAMGQNLLPRYASVMEELARIPDAKGRNRRAAL